MITIACVLRSGGDFSPVWVWALRRGLDACLPAGTFRFRCLTDVPLQEFVWRGRAGSRWHMALKHNWPGWWSKMELLRGGIFPTGELVMALDLDTLPWDRLDDMARYPGQFAMLSSFYTPTQLQSGVLLFRPGPHTAALYDEFRTHLPPLGRRIGHGDGEWLSARVPEDTDRIQDLYPGQVVSFKREAKHGPPAGARLVCGHGRPRFNDPASGWAYRHWRLLVSGSERV